LSSTEIFILDASKPSKTQLENIPYLAKHSFQQKKKDMQSVIEVVQIDPD
jgi:hypothetical protein